jgi:nucleoside-diphosphate-sugar epimerase
MDFDHVIWFGGHSSVSQSTEDPNGALVNNCLNLFKLAKIIPKDTKFIYASSASLYSSKKVPTPISYENSITAIPSNNPYDISKFAFDYLAENFMSNFYGLRMGTLCGYSPNLRQELVFNSMNLSAVQNGFLNLMNSNSSRTILFLEDLWIFIKKLLTTNQQPGFFNVGSYSMSMGELATEIANAHKAKVIYKGDTNTYSFLMDTTKMKAICGSELKEKTLNSRCQNFISECKQNNILN